MGRVGLRLRNTADVFLVALLEDLKRLFVAFADVAVAVAVAVEGS